MKSPTPNKALVAGVSRWTVKINLSVQENMDIHSTLIHILNGESNWFCTFTAILIGSKNDLLDVWGLGPTECSHGTLLPYGRITMSFTISQNVLFVDYK